MDNINAIIARGIVPEQPFIDISSTQARQNALTLDTSGMQNEAARMGLEDQKVLRPMKNEIAQMAYLRDVGQTVTWENYPAFYEHATTKIGLRPTQLPSVEQVQAMGPQAFEKRKLQDLTTLDQKIKLYEQQNKPTVQDLKDIAAARSGTRKIGDKQTYQKGDQEITERWNGTEWEVVGGGPKWAPPQPKEEKPPTEKYTKEDKLIADALREELGGIEPTASQILKRKKELAREMAGERRSHVLPEKATENMSGALDSVRLLDEIGGVADEALGIPGVGSIWMYVKSKGGGEGAQLFLNNLRQLKVNAQSLIKGIPSNFDVQTFINSLPKEDDTPKEARKKIEIARKILEDALKTGMQNYKKQYEIPEYMRERYEAANIKGSLVKKTIRYDAQGNRVE